MKTALVTGANGFIGQHLCRYLESRDIDVIAVSRKQNYEQSVNASQHLYCPDLYQDSPEFLQAISQCDTVFHLAGYAHRFSPQLDDVYSHHNTQLTQRVISLAKQASVKRFIYLSTALVHGDLPQQKIIDEDAPINPQCPYTRSKWQAEQLIHKEVKNSSLEFVIIRPPLVYGEHCKGNFLRLLQWVSRSMPLPLAGINNQRSMVYVGNLVAVLFQCANHSAAVNQTYFVTDGEDVSTTELLQQLAHFLQCPSRLWRAPLWLLAAAAKLLRRETDIARLLNSYQISHRKICRDLAWQPEYSLLQGLENTAVWFKQQD